MSRLFAETGVEIHNQRFRVSKKKCHIRHAFLPRLNLGNLCKVILIFNHRVTVI